MPNQPLTRDEARARARLLSGVSYAVALTLEDGDTFTSDSTAEFDCARPGASTFVDLEAHAVVSAELNGRPIPAEAFAVPAGYKKVENPMLAASARPRRR